MARPQQEVENPNVDLWRDVLAPSTVPNSQSSGSSPFGNLPPELLLWSRKMVLHAEELRSLQSAASSQTRRQEDLLRQYEAEAANLRKLLDELASMKTNPQSRDLTQALGLLSEITRRLDSAGLRSKTASGREDITQMLHSISAVQEHHTATLNMMMRSLMESQERQNSMLSSILAVLGDRAQPMGDKRTGHVCSAIAAGVHEEAIGGNAEVIGEGGNTETRPARRRRLLSDDEDDVQDLMKLDVSSPVVHVLLPQPGRARALSCRPESNGQQRIAGTASKRRLLDSQPNDCLYIDRTRHSYAGEDDAVTQDVCKNTAGNSVSCDLARPVRRRLLQSQYDSDEM